eukprot:CAMPEP_0115021314 /NCGR_PEP_ID=MMETSP0216-20121206/30810_1 /TAXON_ID=223996 /ORGANISM="Protocruzia adherens, Strain Boccale" /LENGTH=223 /DNA_ID=CAMNT_0002393641 /DNA_START=154 /DNA_END=825 /DNA_ORIENTATION=+
MNVKYCAIGRIRDGVLLVTYAHESRGPTDSYKYEVSEILGKLSEHPIGIGERQRISTQTGIWNYLCDDNMVTYFVLTSSVYAERNAFAMIEELQSNVSHYDNLLDLPENGLKRDKDAIFRELCRKFEDVTEFDQLAAAQKRVDSVHNVMSDNVKKIMKNHEDVSNLQGKTEDMRGMAKSFNKKAHDVKRIMWWRKCKINFILFLIVAAVLLYILVPIINDMSG